MMGDVYAASLRRRAGDFVEFRLAATLKGSSRLRYNPIVAITLEILHIRNPIRLVRNLNLSFGGAGGGHPIGSLEVADRHKNPNSYRLACSMHQRSKPGSACRCLVQACRVVL